MPSKFKIGDKIKATKNNPYTVTNRDMKVGVVTKEATSRGIIEIMILDHKDKSNNREKYNVNQKFFEKIKNDTIVIYREDNKVTALDKSTGEKAIARCNPTDTFDFRTGAKLAFDRLMGKEKSDVQQDIPNVVKCNRYEVGDKVLIFSYDTLAKVYGTDHCGDISSISFATTMAKYGNKVLTVKNVRQGGRYYEMKGTPLPYGFHKNTIAGKVVEEDEKPTCYTGIIEILDNGGDFRKGDIVEIKNGKFKDKDNYSFPVDKQLKNFEDVISYFTDKYCFASMKIKEIKETKRMAKAGEYVLITNVSPSDYNEYKTGDILKICETLNKWGYYKCEPMKFLYPSEYVVLEGYVPVEDFKPYLRLNNRNYGIIGEKTNLVDIIGRHLDVGDVVELYCNVRGKLEDSVIVNAHGKSFVMGVAMDDFSKPIESKCGYKILLKKRAKDILDGTMARKIEYVKSER